MGAECRERDKHEHVRPHAHANIQTGRYLTYPADMELFLVVLHLPSSPTDTTTQVMYPSWSGLVGTPWKVFSRCFGSPWRCRPVSTSRIEVLFGVCSSATFWRFPTFLFSARWQKNGGWMKWSFVATLARKRLLKLDHFPKEAGYSGTDYGFVRSRIKLGCHSCDKCKVLRQLQHQRAPVWNGPKTW